MGRTIAHRGPDGEGLLIKPGIGLVHRRLSIIDIEGGNQPIGNEDGMVQVILNGEIYNYRELRTILQSRGHRFRTNSDTEVLVHLYEDEGDEFVTRLRGMFAFAIWDQSRNRLLLARDRLGIKPLYFYRDAEKLIFASEPKAILSYPGFAAVIDPSALEDFLAFGTTGGVQSIFRGIEKLPPAHTYSIGGDLWSGHSRRYWQLVIAADESPAVDQWQDEVTAKFDEAVKLHMVSDVPVGAFLSGGLDSSAIVAAATRVAPEPLHTFAVGFREGGFSELPYASEVSASFGTTHIEAMVTPNAVDLLEQLSEFFDEPFADASAVPTYLVSRLAANQVKVVLSGDGGDEAFGGYQRYAHDLREAAIRRFVPRWIRKRVLSPLATVWPKLDWLPRPIRAKTLFRNIALDPDRAYANTLSRCRPPLRRQLIAPDMASSLNGHDPSKSIRTAFARASPDDALGGMLSADIETILPDDFLVKVDRASMAVGLEVRPPLLDHELLELAARIPSRWKIHRGETKWLFKRTQKTRLPTKVLTRRKQGFDVPLDVWLRGPLRERFEDAVLNRKSGVAELIDIRTADQLFRAHLAGASSHGQILWALLILSHWSKRYLAA